MNTHRQAHEAGGDVRVFTFRHVAGTEKITIVTTKGYTAACALMNEERKVRYPETDRKDWQYQEMT